MLQRSRLRSRRSAFTLVELMVVILIISILSALLTVAVSSAISKGKKTRNQVDISQLTLAVEAFKARYKVDYIPSRLYLSESGKTYQVASGVPVVADSFAYLQRIWPRLGNGFNPVTNFFVTPIDWNGSGNIETAGNTVSTLTNPNGDMILEGDQVLVFLLGGIPHMDPNTGVCSCTGFAKSPSNPAAHVGTSIPAENPLFEFDSSRLVNIHQGSFFMLSYLDTYGSSDPKMNLVCKGNRDANNNVTGAALCLFQLLWNPQRLQSIWLN